MYKELYPFDFVRMTDTNNGRIFPYRGMNYADYSRILTEFGTYPLIISLKDKDGPIKKEHENLYSYIESGIPALASFGGHVVCIIGHTLEYKDIPADIKTKEVFLDSSFFVKQYIVCDDNFFPYQLLGYQCDLDNYGAKYTPGYTIDHIAIAVCPLPEKAFLPVEKARERAFNYLGTDEFKEIIKNTEKPLITRLFMTTSSSFKKMKLRYARKCLELKKYLDNSVDIILNLSMPHFIWVMEVGTYNQYRERKVFAEIVIDTTSGGIEKDLVYARIRDMLYIKSEEIDLSEGNSNSDFWEFDQYTHNLGEVNHG
ncbi:MAG: hypothetical protein H7844_07500 [Nitrospirae bacterium YQR-1]